MEGEWGEQGAGDRPPRPVGITIISVVTALTGVGYFALSLVVISIIRGSLGGGPGFSSTGALLPSLWLALFILAPGLVLAVGLWRGWKAAWWLQATVFLSLAASGLLALLSSLGFGSLSILDVSKEYGAWRYVMRGTLILMPVLVYLYMLSDRVRAFFRLLHVSKLRATITLLMVLAILVLGRIALA